MRRIEPHTCRRPVSKLLIAGLVTLLVTTSALGAEIADVPWDESNIETLRSFDNAAVQRLVDEKEKERGTRLGTVSEFMWEDLAGDGQYQLLVALNGLRGRFNLFEIYSRDSSGKINCQGFRGWRMERLKSVIRDLDGDGVDELVVPTGPEDDCHPVALPMAVWPKVYRLRKLWRVEASGTVTKCFEYLEASREFANFYDTEVLPQLESAIKKARERAEHWPPNPPPPYREAQLSPGEIENWHYQPWREVAALMMTKEKIIRVLGRDPTAGQQEALKWMKSPDAELRIDAAEVFGDMAGHEKELDELVADKVPWVGQCAKFALGRRHAGVGAPVIRWSR